MRSLETGKAFGSREATTRALIAQKLITPTPDRLNYIRFALASGYSVDDSARDDLHRSVVPRADEGGGGFRSASSARPRSTTATQRAVPRAPSATASPTSQLAKTWGATEIDVRDAAQGTGRAGRVQPRGHLRRRVRKLHAVPLFELRDRACEADPGDRKKVMILGSGPNRIGQGIEFDYCCCHASFALQEMGVESIMVNCNPETVSTDYDTSDRLYFEPLTLENVLNIYDTEKPDGVIVQFGGQTPLNSGAAAEAARACRSSAPIPTNIDLAEDRKLFGKLLDELKIPCPANGTATSVEEACAVARAHRLSGAGAAQLRAGRARHGDRLRRGDGAAVHARGGDLLAGPPGADRPLPGRRHRSGRGRARRRRRTC